MQPAAQRVTGAWRPRRWPAEAGRALLEPSPFSKLALVHVIAMAGDALITMALAGSLFFDISPTAARGRVTLSLVLTMAPFAVVAPFLGPAIDRTRRGRRAMVFAACIGRMGTALAMARVIDSLLLFPVAFATLVLSKSYSVAKSSLVPSAVDSEHELVEANSKLAIGGVVGGFLAAIPGVLLLELAGAEWVLRLAAVVFAVAAVASLRVVERRAEELAPELRGAAFDGAGGPDGATGVGDGNLDLTTARGRAHLAALSIAAAAAAMALLRALVGFLTFLVAFDFRRQGAPSWWFGVVLAASMAAGLSGAALAPRLRNRLREERILLGCLLVTGVTGLVLARFSGRIWAAGVAMAVGVAASAGKLSFDALVQRDAPDAVRGRSFARFETGFQLCWVVGALLPVVVVTPLRMGMDVIGVASLAAAVAYFFSSRWLRRRFHG